MEFPSVIPLVIKKYYYRGIYRQNEAGNFIFFISDGFTDGQKITDKSFTDGAFSVDDFVGKLITNGICVLRRQKNSIGKTVKSCSDLTICHIG
jgi:hypothetical protein